MFWIFLSLLIHSICSYDPDKLLYKAHSINDLDFFIQLLKKGVDAFKIDVTQVYKDDCIHFSAKGNKTDLSKCELANSIPICCLGLRGDCSSMPFLGDYFNTTDEFIELLKNPEFQYIFSKNNSHESFRYPITISIYYRFNFTFSNMITNFIYDMIKTVDDYELNIIFMFSLQDEYIKKCGKENCSEKEKYIANAPIFRQVHEENVEFPKRSQFNFGINISNFCNNGFPSWMQKNVPINIHEPSNEDEVKTILGFYTDPKCKLPNNYRLKDLRLTANLEKEMMEIYANDLLPYLKSHKIEKGKLMYLEYEPQLNGTLIFVKENTKIYIYLGKDNGEISTFQEINVDPLSLIYKESILILSNEAKIEIYTLSNGKLSFIKEIIPVQKETSETKYAIATMKNGKKYILISEKENNNVSLSFIIMEINDLSLKFELNVEFPYEIDNFDFDIIYNVGNSQWDMVILSSSTVPNAYMDSPSLVLRYSKLTLDDSFIIVKQISNDKFNGWGSNPHIKLVYSPNISNDSLILATFGNGSCQAGYFYNNNQLYKCYKEISKSNAAMLNIRGLLGYHFLQTKDIDETITNGLIVDACAKKAFSSKLAYGNNHFISLGEKGDFVFGYENLLYDELSVNSRLFCGSVSKNEEFKGIKVSRFQGFRFGNK